jgi:hypothetical protein
MSVPTVTSCTPAAGPAGGRQLVQIVGTGFRTPPAPPASGPAAVPADTVRVTFGGVVAAQVAVVSAVSLFCLTPISPTLAAVNVVVQNLDDDGVPVAGESATLTAGYTYQLKKLVIPCDLERVEMALVVAVARQVCPNAMFTVDTDYDSATVDGLQIPDTTDRPAVVLMGPDMNEDPMFGVGTHTEEAVSVAGSVAYYKNRVPPVPMSLAYNVIVIAQNREAFLRLMVDAVEFRRRMPYLYVDKDGADATRGQVRFLLQVTDPPHSTTVPNISNLRTFAMGLEIRGVPLEGTRGDDDALVFERTYPVETVTVGAYPESA